MIYSGRAKYFNFLLDWRKSGFKLFAERWTLNAERWTLNAERWTLNAERWTLNAERWTLNAERFFFPIKKAWKNQAFCISDKPAVPLTGLWA